MNLVVLKGRATKKPEVSYTTNGLAIARYTLAVDRYNKDADFISVKALGKAGEFAEKYIDKGTEILVVGNIQTGHYTGKDGKEVYTTDILVDRHEFCGKKEVAKINAPVEVDDSEFMSIPDGLDTELPFV